MWESGSSVHLKDYLRVIQKNLSLVFLTLGFTVLVTFFFNQFIEPVYRAETRLLVEEKLQDVNLTQNMLLPYRKEFLQTQLQILQSDPVFESAILATKIDKTELVETSLSALGRRFKALLGLDYSLTEEQLARDEMEKAVQRLRKTVFMESIRGTNIILVQVDHANPLKAQLLANGLAESFIKRSLYLRNKDSLEASEFLKSQVGEIQKRLSQSEKKLEEFQFSEEAISLDKRIDFLVEKQIVVAEKELEDVLLDLEEEREKVKVLHAQVLKERGKKSAGEKGTVALLLEQQLQLELKLEELLRKFTRNHPDVVSVDNALILLKKRIQEDELKTQSGEQQAASDFLQSLEKEFSDSQREYRILAVRDEQLRRQIASQKDKLRELLKKKSDFLVLQRELKANEKLYELLLKKEKEVGVESSLNVGHVKQVQQATLPVYPVRPKKVLNLLLSVIAGLFLGIAMTFLKEYMDRSLKTMDEISRSLAPYPLMGVLNHDEVLEKESHLLPKIVYSNPNSILGESFKILRANIQNFIESGDKVLAISSSLPNEGKSTIATNLALSFALGGKKVLIVDLDLRKPKLHTYFQLNEAISDLIYPTEVENLSLWRAPQVSDYTRYLESQEFKDGLKAQEALVDVILLDTAPMNLVSDTSTLLRQGIPLLWVVGAGCTTGEQIERSKNLLMNLKVEVKGYVISKLEPEEMPDDYYSYYEGPMS